MVDASELGDDEVSESLGFSSGDNAFILFDYRLDSIMISLVVDFGFSSGPLALSV